MLRALHVVKADQLAPSIWSNCGNDDGSDDGDGNADNDDDDDGGADNGDGGADNDDDDGGGADNDDDDTFLCKLGHISWLCKFCTDNRNSPSNQPPLKDDSKVIFYLRIYQIVFSRN